MELGLFGSFDGGQVGTGDPGPIRVAGGRTPILALHGFTGTPNEVRLVTDVAAKVGARAYAPLLPGHGTHARFLARTSWEDWVGAADRALTEVLGDADRAVVAGLSMGSLLAMHLAATRPERVAGLVVLANAAWLPLLFPTLPLVLLERSGLPTQDFYLPKSGADINDPAAKKAHMTYSVNPIKAAIELLRGGRVVRGELGKITCPTFIAHGRKDKVCPPRNATRVAERLGTNDVKVVFLAGSGHIVTSDVDRAELSRHIESFVLRIEQSEPRAEPAAAAI